MPYTNIWIADKPMTKSVIDLSTEKIFTDSRHPSITLYSASFILGDEDLPQPYGEIAIRMKVALKAHNRFYQWIIIPDDKVVYSKFNDLP
jgi:hypothetical protein